MSPTLDVHAPVLVALHLERGDHILGSVPERNEVFLHGSPSPRTCRTRVEPVLGGVPGRDGVFLHDAVDRSTLLRYHASGLHSGSPVSAIDIVVPQIAVADTVVIVSK